MHNAGDVVLAIVQFADGEGAKIRPAVVLFEEHGNIVIAGITSNTKMDGIPITEAEGAAKTSVIKLNYLFTISDAMIYKRLFRLSDKKRRMVFNGLVEHLGGLTAIS